MRSKGLCLAVLLALGAWPAGQAAAAPVGHQTLTYAGATVHVLTVPSDAHVRPVAARPGHSVPDWARRSGAIAAINGGYFNHSDGWPVSFVLADGQPLTDPRHNRALLANATLRPLLPRIFESRWEWRSLEDRAGARRWTLAPHSAPLAAGETLRHALQAGPALLPAMNFAGEAFVLKDARGRVVRDGIGTSSRAARSALGLTARGDMLLVAVAGSTRRGTGVTVPQLATLMKHLGAVSALGLDGGSSTTLAWQEGGRWRTFVGSGEGPALVNSALVVLP